MHVGTILGSWSRATMRHSLRACKNSFFISGTLTEWKNYFDIDKERYIKSHKLTI